MLRKHAQKAALLMLLGLLYACGDQSLFMSLRTDVSDLQVTTVNDGQIVSNGSGVPLTISAQDTTKLKDLEMEVTLSSSTGQSVWHNRQAVPALNEQLTVQPPALAAGQYRMDIVIYSSGEVAQKKSSTFFVEKDGWRIAGIKSYPPVITSAGKVLLKADLQYPDGADPWLRWTWKGKVIQKGSVSQGLGKILWTVPADEGVYTITLEMFPAAPADSDYSFTSPLSLSADVYVSTGARPGRGDLGPEGSYLTLLHLQATLDDVGVGAKKAGQTSATAIGSPEIVSTEDGFGYHLAPGVGFSLGWLALPADGGSLKPFTASFGISFDSFSGQNVIFQAASADGSFSFTISVDAASHMPQAELTVPGTQPTIIPWSGAGLSAGQRYLLSLSVIPQAQSITALWYLNGLLAGIRTVAFSPITIGQDGKTLIGGANGFSGVIDEAGVYFRDEQGRPSTDRLQYHRVAALKYGQDLVMAEGFEGIYPPAGFSADGKASMAPGGATIPADSGLLLPSVAVGGAAVSFSLDFSQDSPRSALLRLQWEGESVPALEVPVTTDGGALKFRINANGKSLTIQGSEKAVVIPPQPSSSSSLRIALANPPSAHAPITLLRVLAHRDRE